MHTEIDKLNPGDWFYYEDKVYILTEEMNFRFNKNDNEEWKGTKIYIAVRLSNGKLIEIDENTKVRKVRND